ncbi:MAG TPA: hypothetical protein VME41_00810 [Stellaceae bacterium]|nr:hypothetical protein [Stellaceae bacterium]
MAKRSRPADLTERRRAAAHYREYAAQIRVLADGERDGALRERLRAIVAEYEARAEELDPRS